MGHDHNSKLVCVKSKYEYKISCALAFSHKYELLLSCAGVNYISNNKQLLVC